MHCKEPVRHYVKFIAVLESDAPLSVSGAFIHGFESAVSLAFMPNAAIEGMEEGRPIRPDAQFDIIRQNASK